MEPSRPSAAAIATRQRDLRIASFSDVHLNHAGTPTSHILANLYQAFPDNAETAALDVIWLGGDLFDSMMHYDDPMIVEIEKWMYHLLYLCHKYQIALRVLEGTFSHDRGQGVHFEKVHQQAPFKADFRYVRTIEVEIHERLGISILYVPDYTTTEMDRLWKESQEALAKVGLTSVDYANIHGAFTYQMPPIAKVQAACHAMDRYLSIVNQYIFTGHIHLSSVYDRIYCNGSFDRLNHGEEEDKGHWRLLARKNGEDDFTFVINTGAKIYKSIDCHALDIDAAWEKVTTIAALLPSESAVRLLADRSHPILHGINRLRKDFPTLQWTAKTTDAKEVQKYLLQDLRGEFVEQPITPDSLVRLLTPRIQARTIDNPLLQQRCFDILQGLLT